MINHIIKKEFKETLRDGRFKIASAIIILLAVTALFITSNQYKTVNNQHIEAKQKERKAWESQGDKTPHSAAHYGNYVFKPKSPLSLIDQGVDKYTGISIFLEAHKRSEAQFSNASDQTALSRFGELTIDFILLYILPLIIILIGYNSFTKEIEGSTYQILKSQGIVGWKLLFGKWLATLIPPIAITTILFLISGVLLTSIDNFGTLNWSALGTLYFTYCFYYIVLTNIVLLISSLTRKSGISLVINLFFWVLACFVTPKIASNLAESQYPFPTHQEFSKRVEEENKKGLDGHNPWSKEAKKLEKEVLQKYGVDSLHKLPFNFSAYRMQKGEEYQAAVYAKHYNYLEKQAQNQYNVYKSASIISPFLPTRFLSMAITQTDYNSHRDFAEAAEQYRIEAQRFLNGTEEKNSKYGERYVASNDIWSKLPEFKYEKASFASVVPNNFTLFLILLLWFGISGIALLLTNKKY